MIQVLRSSESHPERTVDHKTRTQSRRRELTKDQRRAEYNKIKAHGEKNHQVEHETKMVEHDKKHQEDYILSSLV